MMNHNFRQFAFIIAMIYTITVGETSSRDDFNNIFLRIYVGNTMHEYVDYSLKNVTAITSRIINNKPTVMYIHGFRENVESDSVQIVLQAYLKRNDHNIIAVDYGKLSNDSYTNVTIRNIPRIVETLATALDKMWKLGFDTEKLHIVGHSLGSHISGYIGRKVSFLIPRITGLDPAGPLYNYLLPSISFSDARFVDIIHTDYGNYGIAKIIGTVDFFPNGGKRIQPGCSQYPIFYQEDEFCSHGRAIQLYAESLINEFAFLGVQCPSLSPFISGKCNNNTEIVMGYATLPSAKGTVYLMTNDQSPFGLNEQGLISTNWYHENCNMK